MVPPQVKIFGSAANYMYPFSISCPFENKVKQFGANIVRRESEEIVLLPI